MPTGTADVPYLEEELALAYELFTAAEDAGVNLTELSRRTGISHPQLSRFRALQKSMRYGEFLAICQALNLRPSMVIAGAEARADERRRAHVERAGRAEDVGE